ncbi:serine protease [Halobacteriovorax sp. HLS]|uniref:trypsin-like serine peptidase n=1 Tax=Halobacteriovorax sp. HLS TaxID=2234000 RepID=UPI000FDBEF9F|nr:trypsin-like serine protease [Halobacteriovorax sp. HLS]
MLTKATAVIAFTGLLSLSSFASEKSICGATDDRVPSNNPKVARALDSRTGTGGCTVTMIGRTCAISAGHCKSVLKIAEFNTPMSDSRGRIQHPGEEDVYEIDQDSIVYKNGGIGNDYAVMKVLPNKKTGAYAGDVQGSYNVSFEKPNVGDIIRITGYGLDRNDRVRNLAQQTHTGEITVAGSRSNASQMNHIADTMGGNSGSSIINEITGEVVAIHTHGGCSSRGGSNSSTLISAHQVYMDAITACLATEPQ